MGLMRIEGPRGPSDIKKSEKTRKNSGTGGVFGSMLESETEEAGQTRSAAPMGAVGGLWAVQGAEDPLEGKKRKRMLERADKVLDALDGVREGLLGGTLSAGHLSDVSRAVGENREKITDPRLLEIMDEVDLRAQVEMAKMEMAKNKK
jgi:hypothetical protein